MERSPEIVKRLNQKICDCFYFLKELSDLPEEEILKRMSEEMFFIPIPEMKKIIAADPDMQ